MIIFYIFSHSRVTANTLLQNMCILNQKHFNINKYIVLLMEAHLFRRCLCDLLPVHEFISSPLSTLIGTAALDRTSPVPNKKLRKHFDSKLKNSTTNLINLWSKCCFFVSKSVPNIFTRWSEFRTEIGWKIRTSKETSSKTWFHNKYQIHLDTLQSLKLNVAILTELKKNQILQCITS